MKKRLIFSGFFLLLFLLSTVPAQADFFTFQPQNLDQLDHGYAYEWGIDLTVPSGHHVVSATLTINGIRNWQDEPNDLFAHLFDNTQTGVHTQEDNVPGTSDFFAGVGHLLQHWQDIPSTATNLVHVFTSAEVTLLESYVQDGNFGLGFDSDCVFILENPITLTVETAHAPVPATLLLLGSGVVCLVGLRRRYKVG